MVFQAVALICTAPIATDILGTRLYEWTGRYNVEDFIGHCFFIAAAGATVHHALTRMEDQSKFGRHVVAPIAAAFFVRLYLFLASQGSHFYVANYFEMPEGWHTKAYWFVTCATIIYLLGYTARLMLVLRRNPIHRRTANVYLFGATVGILTCSVKIASGFFTTASYGLPLVVWLGCCLGVAGFAFGYGYSWRARVSEFVRPVVRQD